jgi:hypothetical protein
VAGVSDSDTDAGAAGGRHQNLAPELRALAQAVLDRLDPAVRLLAARAASSGSPGACQQVWCPVCALAALVSGEEHPLLSVIAEHSTALLTVVRAVVEDMGPPQDPDRPPPPPGSAPQGPPADPPGPGRYQHIPVTVEE